MHGRHSLVMTRVDSESGLGIRIDFMFVSYTKRREEKRREEQSRAEQSRAEQSRAEQSRAEQSRAEQRNGKRREEKVEATDKLIQTASSLSSLS